MQERPVWAAGAVAALFGLLPLSLLPSLSVGADQNGSIQAFHQSPHLAPFVPLDVDIKTHEGEVRGVAVSEHVIVGELPSRAMLASIALICFSSSARIA